MKVGSDPSGKGDFATQLYPEDYWDIRMLILVTSRDQKKMGSTEAMIRSENTSPFYQDWVKTSVNDIKEMRKAIAQKDFERTGELAESNALKMHALTISSNPPVIYWNETTVRLMHCIRELRRQGIAVYFTIDAGPQIKALTMPEYEDKLENLFSDDPGVIEVINCKAGGGTALIGERD